MAYLNVDCAVQGPGFFPSTTPQFDNLLTEITKKVSLVCYQSVEVLDNDAF